MGYAVDFGYELDYKTQANGDEVITCAEFNSKVLSYGDNSVLAMIINDLAKVDIKLEYASLDYSYAHKRWEMIFLPAEGATLLCSEFMDKVKAIPDWEQLTHMDVKYTENMVKKV